MSLFPRSVQNDFGSFGPVFKLMDDYANHVMASSSRSSGFGPSAISTSLRSFQPRFDVKENKNNYELHGELPGIEQKDINIEFTDAQTLTVKGRTERVREEGQRPAGLIEGQGEQNRITEDGEKDGYHKPTVEEEGAKATEGDAIGVEVSKESAESGEVVQQQQQQQEKAESKASRYWVAERSIGEFSRTFAFPDRVDQENVKASLKNGILSIVVPKAAAPVSRRINVE